MAIHMVTWNLNQEPAYEVKRQAFIEHINRYANVRDPSLETVRWVESAGTAEQMSADLLSKLDKNDRLFVTQVLPGQHQGWLNQEVWNWINARLR
ncbi:hypothetical protein XaraCFBP7407_06230 [Xanthomonas arboricola pv. arracaciae]|uniref:hypothetical protein n=1 Tax=Xanthomonas arboricola TaxID=56448 RepID=UPI000CEED5B9|nr:hypothetical protein [Xanthomonas arboricola]PPT97600.1 hypothetical protein XaraCFBP7407_06230 [Xanthomonas arboricola pv. arracaciae]